MALVKAHLYVKLHGLARVGNVKHHVRCVGTRADLVHHSLVLLSAERVHGKAGQLSHVDFVQAFVFVNGAYDPELTPVYHADHALSGAEAFADVILYANDFPGDFGFDNFIADFVCLSKKVIIEIDGKIHNFQKEQDEQRTIRLDKLGYEVIRFTNAEVLNSPYQVAQKIKAFLNNRPDSTSPTPS